MLKNHRYHNKIQAPFLSPFKHQKWTSRLGVASTIYFLPINCISIATEDSIFHQFNHLYTNFTTFSILARYQPGPWSRSCGMVSLRNSQWENNYQMAWLWFTCLVLMPKPLLLTKDNGWKSSTIWATIPLWAARALGSSFDQKLEGGGASGKSWGSKVDF